MHKGSDEWPTIIWTPKAASKSMADLGGDHGLKFTHLPKAIRDDNLCNEINRAVFKLTPIHDA